MPVSCGRESIRCARLGVCGRGFARPGGPDLHKYVIIGPQGSGKSTQGRLLASRFDFVHISIGDIIRWHLEQRTKLASRIRVILDSGNLIHDEVVMDVVRRRLHEHDWNYGFVLDGFPRSRAQADLLRQSWDIDQVIYIDVPDDITFKRVLAMGRAGWGSGYTKRAYDHPDAVRRRIQEYHRLTKPMLELYGQLGILTHVEGNHSISGVFARITRALQLIEGPV